MGNRSGQPVSEAYAQRQSNIQQVLANTVFVVLAGIAYAITITATAANTGVCNDEINYFHLFFILRCLIIFWHFMYACFYHAANKADVEDLGSYHPLVQFLLFTGLFVLFAILFIYSVVFLVTATPLSCACSTYGSAKYFSQVSFALGLINCILAGWTAMLFFVFFVRYFLFCLCNIDTNTYAEEPAGSPGSPSGEGSRRDSTPPTPTAHVILSPLPPFMRTRPDWMRPKAPPKGLPPKPAASPKPAAKPRV